MTHALTQNHPILRAAFLAASVAALVFAMGFALMPLAASANNGGIVFPSCPIEDRDNRIVVALDPSQFLYGAGSESGPFWVNIGSGTYDITLASFDNHSEKGGQGQEFERWQLKLLDSSGVILGVTALISDLPDADDVRVEKVNTGFMIPADVAKLRPFHPDEGNSIRPLCAAFDLVSQGGTGTDTGGGTATTASSSSNESSGSGAGTANSATNSSASCGECGGIGGGGVTETPLAVSEERAQWIGQAIVVTWKTNIPATSRVYYGTQSVEPPLLDEHLGYATSTMLATTTVTEHTVEIVDADPGRTYYLRPASQETPEQNFRIAGYELQLLPSGASAAGGSSAAAGTPAPILASVTNMLIERNGGERTCGPYLTSFIDQGAANVFTDVAKLQLFLWQYEGFSDLRITGVYDAPTQRAVEIVQIRYAADVLIPWGLTSPTGHVYITTQKKINELHCKRARGIVGEFALSSEAREEIRNYREWLQAERRRTHTTLSGGTGASSASTDRAGGVSATPAPTPGSSAAPSKPDGEVKPLEPSVGSVTPEDRGAEGTERGVIDGAALIVGEIGDRFATATQSGLIGALFAGFSGPSAPTFLGILSLVLLVVGALMLIRSLRSGWSRDSDRNTTLPPSPPFSGPGAGGPPQPSQPRTMPPSPFGGVRGGASMPPPPVAPQGPGAPGARGGSSSVFEMPPSSALRNTARASESGFGAQPVASLLRGNIGEMLRSSVGPITPSADETAHTETATTPFPPRPLARAVSSSTPSSAPSSPSQRTER